MDTLLLSRMQFGALTAFHLLFPAVTLALGWILLAFRLRARRDGSVHWARVFRFWAPIYALSVAFQVVSGWALWTQFNMTWPTFIEQAGHIAIPLRNVAFIGVALQVLPLAVTTSGLRLPSRMVVTPLIACSAIGGGLTVSALVLTVGWMLDPVGHYAGQWELSVADWITLVTNPAAWIMLAQLVLASGVTAGLVLLSLSVLRALTAGHGPGTDATAKSGLMLAASSALLALGVGVVLGQQLVPAVAMVVSVTASGFLLVLRHPNSSLADLPPGLVATCIAAPLGGWLLTLTSWPFQKMLTSVWLIHGQMRVDDATAVLPPGAINATLPVYLVTIGFLTATYIAVLVAMARRTAFADKARARLDATLLRRAG